MLSDIEKIDIFLKKHHVLSLATQGEELSVCSLFYAFSKELNSFVVASKDDTTHIKNISKNNKIAGNILLETKTIGKIQGVQFRGIFLKNSNENLMKLYFKTFPHAKIMMPKLWQIKVNYFKMTDNTLGFGKKIVIDNLS
jgi:uncharacterized protein YhbP (UPF0306 family)